LNRDLRPVMKARISSPRPGARVIGAAFTFPAAAPAAYLAWRASTHSNLYRIRLPQ
jgi:hypothetical protein